MDTAALIQCLMNTLPENATPLVLASLRQDPVVWKSLQVQEFLDKICHLTADRGGGQITDWVPARLAFAALHQSYNPSDVLGEIPPSYLEQVAHAYQDLLQNVDELDLAQAGSIALALAAQNRQNGSWAFLTDEIDQHSTFPWGTCLACLFGMVKEPLPMLAELIFQQPSTHHTRLAIHTLLCQPAETSFRIDSLMAITHGIQGQLSTQPLELLDFLHSLNELAPELAVAYCRKINAQQAAASHLPTSQPFHQTDLLRETAGTLVNLEISRLAGDEAKKSLQLDKLLAMRNLLAASLLTQVASLQPSDNQGTLSNAHLVASWKKAIELVQPVQPATLIDPFKAGLAQALVRTGSLTEAHSLFTGWENSPGGDPYALVSRILSAHQFGNLELARQAGAQLAEIYCSDQKSSGYIAPHALVSPLQIAELLHNIGLSAQAQQVLVHALKQAPNQEAWLNKLVELQMAAKLFSQAAENMQILAGYHPEDLQLRHALAQTYEAYQNWPAALDVWISLADDAQYPSQAEELADLYALAACALNASQPEPAIHASQRVLSLKCEDGLALTCLGRAYAMQHDFGRGMECVSQATQINPSLPQGWLAMADLLTQQGYLHQAVDSLQTAIQILPNHPQLLFTLGELQLRVGNATLAANALKQAAALDPTQTSYHYTLGLAYRQLGRGSEALEELGTAYQAEETNIDFAAAYGAVLLDAGNTRSALKPLITAIQFRQNAAPSVYVDYARAVLDLHNQGDTTVSPQSALDAVETALTLDPERPETKGWYAEALRANGRRDEAFKAYQEALETQLSSDRHWRERLSYGMSQIAYQSGRYDIAIASAQEAVSAAPHNAENYKLLADAYLCSSLFDDSLRAARTVLNLNIDNLHNLAWYADHITRLVSHHDALSSPKLQNQARQAMLEAQNALVQAVQLAPQRADLLIKLSNLQQMAGETASALDTVNLILDNEYATVEHLIAASDQMQSLGNSPGAVLCLEKAVSRDQAGARSGSPQLLLRLARAYVNNGNLSSACDTLEEAISIAPDLGSLYYERTGLLLNLGRTEDAFCCVETGISLARTDPDLPRLYILAAWLYRQNGDLASALGYIRKGIEGIQRLTAPAAGNPPSLLPDDRLLIADIYRAALQPVKAYQMLRDEPDIATRENLFSGAVSQPWIGLKIELELELGYVPEFQLPENADAGSTFTNPGWLALLARLALRNGAKDRAEQYYQSALKMQQEENVARVSQPGLGRIAVRRARISLLEASLDFNDWQLALDFARRLSEVAPDEPYTQLAQVRLIVMQAEFQQACSRLDVLQHAPGAEARSAEQKQALEDSIHQVSGLIQQLEKSDHSYDLAHPITRLERWHSRGQIAFAVASPESNNLSELSAAVARLKLNPPTQAQMPEEAAAVISAQVFNRREPEQTLLAEVLQITRPHSRNPLVWFHAALALETNHSREAFGAARGALQLLTCKQCPLAALDQALLARVALRLNDLPSAQDAINAALSIWSNESRWHLLAAHIQQAAHRPVEGLRHLEQASQLEPSAMAIQLELGKAYLAENTGEPNGVSRAIECFATAVHLAPEDVPAWIWLARAQLRAKQVEAAAKSVAQILLLTPENPEASILQAEIAMLKKSYQAAHTFAQSAVQASPEDPKTTLLLAKTLKSLNRPAEALQVLESALPISQDPLQLQYERAKLLHELHGPDAALQVLTELVTKYPDDANILTSLARSQADLGDLQAATNTALAALKAGKIGLEPEALAGIHFLTGTLLRRSGQLDQAIQHLNQAVSLAPDTLEAYLELGLARKERREYQQALQAFEQATKIAPHDPRPHYQAGLALKEGKDYRRSEMMLRQAAHLAPDDVLVRRQLAQVVALNVVHNPRS